MVATQNEAHGRTINIETRSHICYTRGIYVLHSLCIYCITLACCVVLTDKITIDSVASGLVEQRYCGSVSHSFLKSMHFEL